MLKSRIVRVALLTAAIGGSVLACAGWYLLTRDELKDTGLRLISQARWGDSHELFGYLEAAEQNSEEATEAKLDQLLNQFLLPKLRGFEPKGLPQIFRSGIPNQVLVCQEYAHKDGRLALLGFQIVDTAQGIKARAVCSSLLGAVPQSGPRPEPSGFTTVQLESRLAAFDALMPELRRLDLKGVSDSTGKFRSWDDLRSLKADGLARARRANPG